MPAQYSPGLHAGGNLRIQHSDNAKSGVLLGYALALSGRVLALSGCVLALSGCVLVLSGCVPVLSGCIPGSTIER